MASAGRIIREVVCWNRSVFSKVSLVVSLEILNKSNQTNRRTTDALGQIWNISTEEKKKISTEEDCRRQVLETSVFLLAIILFRASLIPTIRLKSLEKLLCLFKKYITYVETVVRSCSVLKTTLKGKISVQPHTTLCIQFLNRENNDKNNTLPLGKQICFTIVWGCAEILPSQNIVTYLLF